MKRLLFLLTAWWCLAGIGRAQDTLTVMQYNLLYYGNYNSGFADCYETNNNTQRKDECIRTILNHVHPDILTVCEFGATQKLQSDFLSHNLNMGSISYWKSDNIINYARESIINHIFYDSRKMELKQHVALRTTPRDTDVYELYLKTPGLAYGDTTRLVCIVAHPKAGMGYESNRRATMQVAMDYVNAHYAGDNILIMGDFNMYRASESGYQLLTKTYSNPDVRFVDPIASLGGVGEWNNNGQFAPFHTQSTRSYSEECFSGGGLDDRFDMILMSDAVYMGFRKIRYLDRSYHAVGNDGRHFNMSIDQNGNDAVPAEVAEALFDGSDHLPVTMKMLVYDKLDVAEQVASGIRIYPNPTEEKITVETGGESASVAYRIANLLGQTVMTGRLSSEKQEVDVSSLPLGMYVFQVGGINKKIVKR
ncbi:MAG: T9SS type A sorting domain-containing protein [Bacteroidales bacterium]|nr:T9SS type A sorting domain-containing protein [Bacteroidales bacterium]